MYVCSIRCAKRASLLVSKYVRKTCTSVDVRVCVHVYVCVTATPLVMPSSWSLHKNDKYFDTRNPVSLK